MENMAGGNAQKAKMAREKNLEKTKASKGSQLDTNKTAMNIQVVYANIHVHYVRGNVQGTCRSKTSKG